MNHVTTFPEMHQHTLKAPISCVGVGLHSGRKVSMTIRPAAEDHGIVFHRTDLGMSVPARFDHVADTRLCTLLADPANPAVQIGTVEHLMAALAGLGIDNALVEVNAPELPILDGSAQSLVFLLDCAGRQTQSAARQAIQILRPVRVTEGDGFAELRPAMGGFELTVAIDFTAAAIGRQAYSCQLTPDSFREEIASARTFTLLSEIDALRRAGLAQGGSLDNAIVVDGTRVLNPGGLRSPDEFVRHKLLDVIGDLALAGAPIQGRFVGYRMGHALNNKLLRAVMADNAAWRFNVMTPASQPVLEQAVAA